MFDIINQISNTITGTFSINFLALIIGCLILAWLIHKKLSNTINFVIIFILLLYAGKMVFGI